MTLASRLHATPKTIDDRIEEYGTLVRERLDPHFRAAGISYPPRRVMLIGFKQERVLEVYAAGAEGGFKFIRDYPVLAASGRPGPKLRRGDKQVPDGLYRVQALNPNSRFHLSLRLDYPNAFDRAQGVAERRGDLGGDIMIHGRAVSIGCLAMGDAAAEDLFVLAAETGIRNVNVILTPLDFRRQSLSEMPRGLPGGSRQVYEEIQRELARYRRPDLRSSARQVISVQRKLAKSSIAKSRASTPGKKPQYHMRPTIGGTSGRSSKVAKTKPSAFRRPLTV